MNPRPPLPEDLLDSGPLLMSAIDVARELKASLRTVRRLDDAGKLPLPVRVGRLVRWRRDELARWIAAGCPDRREWQARQAPARR